MKIQTVKIFELNPPVYPKNPLRLFFKSLIVGEKSPYQTALARKQGKNGIFVPETFGLFGLPDSPVPSNEWPAASRCHALIRAHVRCRCGPALHTYQVDGPMFVRLLYSATSTISIVHFEQISLSPPECHATHVSWLWFTERICCCLFLTVQQQFQWNSNGFYLFKVDIMNFHGFERGVQVSMVFEYKLTLPFCCAFVHVYIMVFGSNIICLKTPVRNMLYGFGLKMFFFFLIYIYIGFARLCNKKRLRT